MYSPETIERLTALASSLPPEARKWRDAVASGDCASALQLIEAELAVSPDELETRLWWVRCHLEGGQLPLGALTSPLEEILVRLRGATHLYAVACKTFLLLGVRLLDRGQSRLALLMLERADEFCSDGCVGVEERTCVRQALLQALDAELERARTRLENQNYIRDLEEKRRSVEQRPGVATQEAKLRFSGKKKKLLSSKSIMENSVVSEPAVISTADVAPMPEFPPRDEASNVVAALSTARNSRKLSGGIALVALLLTVFAGWQWMEGGAAEALANLAMKTEVISSRHLDVPHLIASVPALGAEDFDALKSRLEKLAAGKRESQSPGEAASQQQNMATLMNSPEVDAAALKGGVSLPPVASGTSSQDNSMEAIGPSRSEIAAKTPILDPNRLAQLPVEDAGSSPRVGSAKGPYARGADGRLYGPSVGTGSAPAVEGAKALDGSPLKAYEVEQFSEAVYFKVIAATDVLDAPSSLATAVGKLEPNAKVQVVSRMGNWLELRSTGGKRGYIYAQDALQVR